MSLGFELLLGISLQSQAVQGRAWEGACICRHEAALGAGEQPYV